MPLTQMPYPHPSKRPYAIDPATFRTDMPGLRKVVDAIWLGRKNGATTVSEGVLSLWWSHRDGRSNGTETLAEAVDNVDPRYGGDAMVRWDGTHLWVNPRQPLTPTEQSVVIARLDSILQTLPNLPSGYDGWYRLTEKF